MNTNEKAIAALKNAPRPGNMMDGSFTQKYLEWWERDYKPAIVALTAAQSAPVVDVNNIKLGLEKKLNAARQTEKTERLQNGLSRTYDNYITGAMYAIDHLAASGHLKSPQDEGTMHSPLLDDWIKNGMPETPPTVNAEGDAPDLEYFHETLPDGRKRSGYVLKSNLPPLRPATPQIDLAELERAKSAFDVSVSSGDFCIDYPQEYQTIRALLDNAIAAQKGGV